MPSSQSSKNRNTDPESAVARSAADSSISQPRASEADERTRLLPPPATGGRDSYLSPDDPAVSLTALKLLYISPMERLAAIFDCSADEGLGISV